MSFTERAGLIPALLLTGCASPSVVIGPPSGSVVDSYLSRSAADISAMQYRIHQSGPSSQRPVSPSTAGGSPNVVTKPPMQSAAGISQQVASTGAFLRQGGSAPTLRSAIKKIVPSDRTLVFDKTIIPDVPEFYSWVGNDRWPYVLNKLLADKGFKATIDEKSKTVTVEPVQKAQASRVSSTMPAQSIPLVVTAPSVSTPQGRNPFRGNESVVPSKQVLRPNSVTTFVGPPLPVMKVWKIEKGSTLRQGFTLWASQENCSPDMRKWAVRWDTGTDYPIDFTLSFKASTFEDATVQLFNLWRTAQVPLYVNGYRQQCLIVVNDGR